jgi:hypothetical protein
MPGKQWTNMAIPLIVMTIMSIMSIAYTNAAFQSLMQNATGTVSNKPPEQIRIQEVNLNSTIADDIINIVHEPQKSKIKIHFRLDEKRRCKQPQLIGHLSGPLVSKLSWEKQLQKESIDGRETEVLTGFYDVPQAGQYFLEILVLMCEELPFETYDGKTCLENPDQNRLTNDGAFIDITIAKQDGSNRTGIGHWYNTQEKMKYEPLYTRYQPQNCRGKQEKKKLAAKMLQICQDLILMNFNSPTKI